jgi:hypothetical protein
VKGTPNLWPTGIRGLLEEDGYKISLHSKLDADVIMRLIDGRMVVERLRNLNFPEVGNQGFQFFVEGQQQQQESIILFDETNDKKSS